jgi:carbamoyltransferase
MKILGLSAFYHDSAAAILVDGNIIAAAQEERFSRIKHDKGFPLAAIAYCLQEAKLSVEELDVVIFYEQPEKKFQRLIKTYFSFAPQGYVSFMKAMPLWLTEKLYQKQFITQQLASLGKFRPEILQFTDHHLSHAASAFFPSPFNEAAILIMDGVGEFATTTIGEGKGNRVTLTKQLNFPHSLGMLYAAFTYYLGFKINSGEYKVMGLAPYGRPIYADLIMQHLVDLKADGSFRLNQQYFNYCTGLTMTSEAFHELFGGPPRQAETLLTQKEFDLAASIQAVTEDIVLSITRALAKTDATGNLCLAGGVALNCVANGKILEEGLFENIWVQPAAGDAGSALGAALVAHHIHHQQPRRVGSMDTMQGSYLGPQFPQADCERRLQAQGAVFEVLPDDELISRTADALASENVVGWFQGRMEFGPRALGNRSILADPRSAAMQKNLNLKVKFRESFRPFAPSVLAEEVGDWFELPCISPYMLLVAPIKESLKIPMTEEEEALFGIDKLNVPRSCIPSVTHIDYSARIQTVHRETNLRYHQLLEAFKQRTGCPILVNTSFNVRGEPIVLSPEDAFMCFMTTDMDVLVVGNCFLNKQNQTVTITHKPVFAPD